MLHGLQVKAPPARHIHVWEQGTLSFSRRLKLETLRTFIRDWACCDVLISNTLLFKPEVLLAVKASMCLAYRTTQMATKKARTVTKQEGALDALQGASGYEIIDMRGEEEDSSYDDFYDDQEDEEGDVQEDEEDDDQEDEEDGGYYEFTQDLEEEWGVFDVRPPEAIYDDTQPEEAYEDAWTGSDVCMQDLQDAGTTPMATDDQSAADPTAAGTASMQKPGATERVYYLPDEAERMPQDADLRRRLTEHFNEQASKLPLIINYYHKQRGQRLKDNIPARKNVAAEGGRTDTRYMVGAAANRLLLNAACKDVLVGQHTRFMISRGLDRAGLVFDAATQQLKEAPTDKPVNQDVRKLWALVGEVAKRCWDSREWRQLAVEMEKLLQVRWEACSIELDVVLVVRSFMYCCWHITPLWKRTCM